MSIETELDFDIENMYSHEQVLEKTFLSPDSLRKKVSNKTFPAPSVYGKSAYKSNWYVKKEVDKWIYMITGHNLSQKLLRRPRGFNNAHNLTAQ